MYYVLYMHNFWKEDKIPPPHKGLIWGHHNAYLPIDEKGTADASHLTGLLDLFHLPFVSGSVHHHFGPFASEKEYHKVNEIIILSSVPPMFIFNLRLLSKALIGI